MKRIILFAAVALSIVSCQKQTFKLIGVFDEQFQVSNNTEIGINIKSTDTTLTYTTQVIGNKFNLELAIPQEQLTVLDLGDLGSTMLAIEKGDVQLEVITNKEGEPIIRKHGTLNNDFIQMYDDYETKIYEYLGSSYSEERINHAIDSILNRIYNTLKGEENVLTDINSLAGIYGFMNYYSLFELDRADTLCSLMDKKTLHNANMKSVYDAVQLQKELSAGKQYKEIVASTPEGNTLALSELIGNTDYVMVDFWASWCGPCRRSMPAVKALYDQYNDCFQILGVSLDSDHEAWTDAIKSLELNWCHISDLQGWQAEGAKTYGVNAIPCTLLIDKDGVIVGRNLSLEQIENILKQ